MKQIEKDEKSRIEKGSFNNQRINDRGKITQSNNRNFGLVDATQVDKSD